jgi:hypothetical protein
LLPPTSSDTGSPPTTCAFSASVTAHVARRGPDALRVRHSFRITDAGIVVYPRIEALLARVSGDDQWPDERCASGSPTGLAATRS